MNRTGDSKGAIWPGAAALALALVPAPLAAQSVNDYRLPGAETPRPDVAGPVDPDNPTVRGPAPRPVATASPSPSPSPSPAPSATPAPARQPAPTATPTSRAELPRTERPVPAAARPEPTLAAPPERPTASPPLPAPSPSSSMAATPVPATLPNSAPAPTLAAPDDAAPWPWLWIAGGIALLVALGAALAWWLRRPVAEQELEFEPPVVTAPAAKATPEPEPAVSPAVAAPVPAGLAIALEARRLNASLMATTLSYNLTLTNHSAEALSALAIEGDMISAHASLPPERQIASQAQRLELRHALVALAPGESAEFSGDFRLPLTEITPIRAGDAAYFVPLARLRVEAATAAGKPLIEAQTFVVGELPERPGAALRPFRLDLGPRNFAKVGQRAVN